MNKNLGYYIREFLNNYSVNIRNFSRNTILSYRDTIKLFLNYNIEINNVIIQNISLELLNKENVLNFLNWLETGRKSSVNTRNQRLMCLKSFCNFIVNENNLNIEYLQDIFQIPMKKFTKKEINFLSKEEISKLLKKPDICAHKGQKALVIMTLLYDAGLRISELINLRVKDIIFENVTRIKIINSKCNKSREIPITKNTQNILKKFIQFNKLDNESYLIVSNRHSKYTSNGIRKILKIYTKNFDFNISPHTFRHTKASHLVETNIPIIYIRDFLGHESIETTLIYTKINGKLKNEAILNNSIELENNFTYNLKDDELLDWLKQL